MVDFLTPIVIGIVSGLIVGVILLILEKTNWQGLYIKRRILWILKRYEHTKNILDTEAKNIRRLGVLLDKGKNKIQSLGFSYLNNGDTISDKNFGIHFTRREVNGVVFQFLIRKLEKGRDMKPDQAYFSEGYPSSQKELSKKEVLPEFIEYFKKK